MIRGKSEAETCRLNGWETGTVLIGDEGYGPEAILITAIGVSSILAKRIQDQRGQPVDDAEGLWSLFHREWKSV